MPEKRIREARLSRCPVWTLSTISQAPDAEAQKQGKNARVEFADYFREVIKERREMPKYDLICIITHADTPESSRPCLA